MNKKSSIVNVERISYFFVWCTSRVGCGFCRDDSLGDVATKTTTDTQRIMHLVGVHVYKVKFIQRIRLCMCIILT